MPHSHMASRAIAALNSISAPDAQPDRSRSDVSQRVVVRRDTPVVSRLAERNRRLARGKRDPRGSSHRRLPGKSDCNVAATNRTCGRSRPGLPMDTSRSRDHEDGGPTIRFPAAGDSCTLDEVGPLYALIPGRPGTTNEATHDKRGEHAGGSHSVSNPHLPPDSSATAKVIETWAGFGRACTGVTGTPRAQQRTAFVRHTLPRARV